MNSARLRLAARRPTVESASLPGSSMSRLLPWLCVLGVLAVVALVRVRLMDLPLERDEGGFAYTAQRMLQGIPPYREAYDMRLPGTYLAYAAFLAVGGETTAAIHLGLLVVNALTVLLMFVLARRLFDPLCAVAAAGAYAVLSLGSGVLGLAAHTTHFVALPVVAACILLAREPERKSAANLGLAGLLMGIAFATKQHSVFFGVFGGLWICAHEWRSQPRNARRSAGRIAAYSLGCVLPFALVCVAVWRSGDFGRFWFWTFTYASEYASEFSLRQGVGVLRLLLPTVTGAPMALWVLAGVGGVAVAVRPEMRGARAFTLGLLSASLLAVLPGFKFRAHYFIVLLPALALLVGAAIGALRDALLRAGAPRLAATAGASALLFAALAHPLFVERHAFFRLPPDVVSRAWYGVNPFRESVAIADYLRAHTSEQSRIAVIGSEPQIYFYAKRRAATGYLYMYGLTEAQPFAFEMQQDLIRELEAAKPEYLVMVNVEFSWARHPDSPTALFDWYRLYAQRYYETVGVVDLAPPLHTEYRWDDAARDYEARSQDYLLVLRRRS
jgi:4-amino-4-deoxy-L-arabinose transferase-like glycosyltransferase